MDKKEFDNMVINILMNTNNIFLDEEDRDYIEAIKPDKIDENYLIAQILALRLHFSQVYGNEYMDLFDFTAMITKLVHQYLTCDLSE